MHALLLLFIITFTITNKNTSSKKENKVFNIRKARFTLFFFIIIIYFDYSYGYLRYSLYYDLLPFICHFSL